MLPRFPVDVWRERGRQVLMADHANGLIWRVKASLKGVEGVAGQYPFLGGNPGEAALTDPLYQPRGLAVTEKGDLIVSQGRALLLIRPEASRGWKAAPAPQGGAEPLQKALERRLEERKNRAGKPPARKPGAKHGDPFIQRILEAKAAEEARSKDEDAWDD